MKLELLARGILILQWILFYMGFNYFSIELSLSSAILVLISLLWGLNFQKRKSELIAASFLIASVFLSNLDYLYGLLLLEVSLLFYLKKEDLQVKFFTLVPTFIILIISFIYWNNNADYKVWLESGILTVFYLVRAFSLSRFEEDKGVIWPLVLAFLISMNSWHISYNPHESIWFLPLVVFFFFLKNLRDLIFLSFLSVLFLAKSNFIDFLPLFIIYQFLVHSEEKLSLKALSPVIIMYLGFLYYNLNNLSLLIGSIVALILSFPLFYLIRGYKREKTNNNEESYYIIAFLLSMVAFCF